MPWAAFWCVYSGSPQCACGLQSLHVLRRCSHFQVANAVVVVAAGRHSLVLQPLMRACCPLPATIRLARSWLTGREAYAQEDYSMVGFLPLNIYDPESIQFVLSHIDNAIQYGEDLEPKDPGDEAEVPDDDGG